MLSFFLSFVAIAFFFWGWMKLREYNFDQGIKAEQAARQAEEDKRKQENLILARHKALTELNLKWQQIKEEYPSLITPAQETRAKASITQALKQDNVLLATQAFQTIVAEAISQSGQIVLGRVPPEYQGRVPYNPLNRELTDLAVIPANIRFEHAYIIGGTGAGKSTLLRHMILADIRAGHGVTVISPFANFFEKLIPQIPPRRFEDVIYLDPDETKRPISMNPLELQPGEKLSTKVGEVLDVFKRAVAETSPIMDALIRNSLYALIERPGSTFADLPSLLSQSDDTLRREIIAHTKDQMTHDYFQETFRALPKNAAVPIFNRIDSLIRNPTVSNILCQPKSTLNLTTAMDQRRIILLPLPPSVYSPPDAVLLGQFLIASISQAMHHRDRQKEHERVPHFLYIDEFYLYTKHSPEALKEILFLARQLQLGITIAHQNLDQIDVKFVRGILSNTSTRVALSALSDHDARALAKDIDPNPADERDVALSLKLQPKYHAHARIGNRVFRIVTFPEAPIQDPEYYNRVRQISTAKWGQAPGVPALAQTPKEAYNEQGEQTPPPPRKEPPEKPPQKPKTLEDFLE